MVTELIVNQKRCVGADLS